MGAGCGMRSTHVVCVGTSRESGSALARAQCPQDSVSLRGLFTLTCWQVREGMGHLRAHACVRVSTWSGVSEHVLV